MHRAAGRRRAELQGPEQEREGEGQDVDEDEQPDDERDGSSPVRLDMRVEAERGHRRVPSALELDLRGDVERLALRLAEVEELARGEAHLAGEQHRRERLDRGVVFRDRVVEEAPRRRELVLDVGELGLQLWKLVLALRSG